jgi:hypothetical protein
MVKRATTRIREEDKNKRTIGKIISVTKGRDRL